MNSRLKHSPEGHMRSVQISENAIFIYTEGENSDSYFYTNVADIACENSGYGYEILSAKELEGGTGGKERLLEWYHEAQEKKFLLSSFKGKKKALFFFLDKDVDGFFDNTFSQKCKCPHITYTLHYDLESHVFHHGDLVKAVAIAGNLSVHSTKINPFRVGWCEKMALLWKEWIAICFYCKKFNATNKPNYKIPSRINTPFNKPFDEKKYHEEINSIANFFNFNTTQVADNINEISKTIEQHIKKGKYYELFKGKWYLNLMRSEVMEHLENRKNGIESNIYTSLMTSLEFSKPWAEHFIAPLQNITTILDNYNIE